KIVVRHSYGRAYERPLIALSPDAKVLANFLGRDLIGSKLEILDLASGKKLSSHDVGAHIVSAGFSPDGNLLATVCGYGVVRLWSVPGKIEVRQLRDALNSYRGGEFAFSPDQRTLALVRHRPREEILVWELISGKLRTRYGGHGVLSLAFSPDGRSLA